MRDYELFQSLCNQFEFSLRVCSSVKHDKKWVEHESKDCYDIWIVTDGEIEIEMDERKFDLIKGDVFFFYPQSIYTARSISETCTFIFIRFDIFLEKNIRPFNDFSFEGYTKAEDIAKETGLFTEVFNSSGKDGSLLPLFFKGSLIMLIAKIAFTRFQSHSILNKHSKKSSYLKIEKALKHIVMNVDKNLSIKGLADYLCMSEKYFITFFKKATGITPFAYISRIKLKYAAEYLSEQKYSVKETAERLGYADQYTFSKAFKRYYGFPPSGIQ